MITVLLHARESTEKKEKKESRTAQTTEFSDKQAQVMEGKDSEQLSENETSSVN